MTVKKSRRIGSILLPALMLSACCHYPPDNSGPVVPPGNDSAFDQLGCEVAGRPAGPASSQGRLLAEETGHDSQGFAFTAKYIKTGVESYGYDALGATQALDCETDGDSFAFSARSLSLGNGVQSRATATVPYSGFDISSAGERPTVSAVIDGGRLGIYPVREASCREGDLSSCVIADDFTGRFAGRLEATIDYRVVAGSFGTPAPRRQELSSIRLSLSGTARGPLTLTANVADGAKLINFREIKTGGGGAYYIWDTTTIESEIPASLGDTIDLEASIEVESKSELICDQNENCVLVIASFSDPWPEGGSGGIMTFSAFRAFGQGELE